LIIFLYHVSIMHLSQTNI